MPEFNDVQEFRDPRGSRIGVNFGSRIIPVTTKIDMGLKHTEMKCKHLEWFEGGADSGISMAVDGSSTEVGFRYLNDGEHPVVLYKVVIFCMNNGITYQNLLGETAGTNGITAGFYDENDVMVHDFLDNDPIKQTIQFAQLLEDDFLLQRQTGDDAVFGTWNFACGGDSPLIVLPNESIRIHIRDDLSGVNLLQMMARGRQWDTTDVAAP